MHWARLRNTEFTWIHTVPLGRTVRSSRAGSWAPVMVGMLSWLKMSLWVERMSLTGLQQDTWISLKPVGQSVLTWREREIKAPESEDRESVVGVQFPEPEDALGPQFETLREEAGLEGVTPHQGIAQVPRVGRLGLEPELVQLLSAG